jgi:hypothetical protein
VSAMAGKAARPAVERCGNRRDTILTPITFHSCKRVTLRTLIDNRVLQVQTVVLSRRGGLQCTPPLQRFNASTLQRFNASLGENLIIRSAREVNPFFTISALTERIVEHITASLSH